MTDEFILEKTYINYYNLIIHDYRSEGITKIHDVIVKNDVEILPNTLPPCKLTFYQLTLPINPYCLPLVSCITFYNYPHIFEENTFQEGLTSIVLNNYLGDINKCSFPSSLKKIYFHPYVKITDDFFVKNPNLKEIHYQVHPELVQIYKICSTENCNIYINGILQ